MKTIKKVLLISLLFILGTSAFGQLADSPWPMFMHDRQHSGRSEYKGPTNPFIFWRSPENQNFRPNEYLVIGKDGTIYVGSDNYPNNQLWAFDPVNGEVKWIYTCDSLAQYINTAPAIGQDGTIYFATSTSSARNSVFLYSLNPDGTLKWKYEMKGVVNSSSPNIGSDSTVYVHTSNGSAIGILYAVNPDGTLRWKKTGEGYEVSPVIDSDGNIYFASRDTIYSITNEGVVNWNYFIPNIGYTWSYSIKSIAVSSDNTILVVVIESSGKLYAINQDGSLKWIYDFGWQKGVNENICVDNDGIIYGVIDDWWLSRPKVGLAAINPDGTLKWKKSGEYSDDITIDKESTIYAQIQDTLFAVGSDSNILWRIKCDESKGAPIIDDNGSMFYTSWSNQLVTIQFKYLEVTSPQNNAYLNKSPVKVKGFASSSFISNLKINEIPVSVVNDSFEVELNLVEGANQIRVVGYDNSNNIVKEIKLKVIFDSVIPSVIITTPNSGQSYSYSPVKVEGSVSENRLVEVLINGKNANVSGSEFSLGANQDTGLEIEEGEFWIKAAAIDSSGNCGVDSVHVNGVPPSPKKLYLKSDKLSWFPFPPYPLNTTEGYSMSFIFDQNIWEIPLKGDIQGSTYSFSLLVGCYGLGSATMIADLILKHNNDELILASTPDFTGSMAGWTPFGYMGPGKKEFTIEGIDPNSAIGDTLILKVRKTGGDRVGLIFIHELHDGHSWIRIPGNETDTVDQPDPPILFDPANGSTNQLASLTLEWYATETAENYAIQVDDNSDFTSPVFNQSEITDTSQQITGLDNNTVYYWRVNASNAGGTSEWSEVWDFTTLVQTEVEDISDSNTNLSLKTYPNPFQDILMIDYKVNEPENLKICIYDLDGQLIRILVNKYQPAGFYSVIWNGKSNTGNDVPNGIYILKCLTSNSCNIEKINIIR